MIKNRQKIQIFRILLHRFRSVYRVSYEPSYLKSIIRNTLVSRIHIGTLTKMIKNLQKIQNVRIFLHRFRPVYRIRIFMNHPQPRFSGLFPRFLLRGFLRLPIVDFEPSRAKITKARSTFQASSSREVKDGKISSPLLEFPKFW